MLPLTKSAIALALLLPVAAFASGVSSGTEPTAEVTSRIHEILAAQGLAVEEIELEDGGFEVEARKDGLEFEVYMDADFNILEIEEDSSEDED